MSFISRLFGKKEESSDSTEDLIAFMERQDAPWIQRGEAIADDVVTKLTGGQVFRISNVRDAIESKFPAHHNVVRVGFHTRLLSHVDAGTVLLVSEEGGDQILVHKDHLNKLRSA